jgi:hypothetical protein
MADAVIMDDNGGVRDPHDFRPVGPMGIRREEPVKKTEIPMDGLISEDDPEETISDKNISEVTVTVNGTNVLGPIPADKVVVTGRANQQVTFTVENQGGDILVTSTEGLIKPKKHEYKTDSKASILSVEVDGRSTPISGNGKVEVTVEYVDS